MRFNALWWWIDRWRKSTAYTEMTLEEQGAYRNLLDEANLRGGAIPNDEAILAKACGDPRRWKKVKTRVLARFVLMPEGWRHPTLDEVIEQGAKRSGAARHASSMRWGMRNGCEPHAQTDAEGDPDRMRRPMRNRSLARYTPGDEIPKNAFSSTGGVGGNISAPDELGDRAARFVERYGELFAEYRRGARYIGRPTLDFQEALHLVGVWDTERLETLVIAFLTTDDPYCRDGAGSIAHFRSRASWCDAKLREKGL